MLIPPAGPLRTICLSVLVNTVGTGLFVTASVIYFTDGLEFSAPSVGRAMTVGGMVSVVLLLAIGRWIDRRGPVTAYVILLIAQALSRFLLALPLTFAAFIAIAALVAVTASGSSTAANALIGYQHQGSDRHEARAYVRSVTNVGVSVGALIAGAFLQFAGVGSLRGLMIGNGVLFLIAAWVLRGLPAVPPPERPKVRRGALAGALRDRRFLGVTALVSISSIHYDVIAVALPIWIVQYTRAPDGIVAAAILLNTIMIILLQVRFSRRAASPRAALRMICWSALAFGVAWPVLGLAAFPGPALAVAMVLLAVAVHSIGELQHSNAGFALSYDLAMADRHGEYQAATAIGRALAKAIAPFVLLTLVVPAGLGGWCVLALVVAGSLLALLAYRRVLAD